MNKWIERIYSASPAAVQSSLVTLYGMKSKAQRFGPRYDRWMAFFEKADAFSKNELESYQDERLAKLIRHVYEKVPYYRTVMRERRLVPDDIRSAADLPKLPILTKSIVRQDPLQLLADGSTIGKLKASPTSGTTGSPFVVYWDRETDVLWNALIWRHRRWAGVEFGERYGTLLGRVVVPPNRLRPPFWRYNAAWNQVLFSSFHLGAGNFGAYIEKIRSAALVAMEAYPSTGYILARGLDEAGVRIPLRAFFTSSEPLLQIERELIEDRFQTQVFDYYGMSEAVMFAGECKAHRGLHHHGELSVVEILDSQGSPSRDGDVGRLVGTNLHNYAMPLIRFEVGDLTSRLPGACSCGRPHPLFSQVTTKAEDIIVTPDGRLVSPSVLTHPLKPLKTILKSQIIQETIDSVRVKLVLGGAADPRELEQVRAGFESRLGPTVRVNVEVVDDIPRDASGKYRWVISKIPLASKLESSQNLYREAGDPLP
jgi:phenylacetate-CoA ligase